MTRQLVTRPAALLLAGSMLVAGCGAPAAASPPPAEPHTAFKPIETKVDSDPDWLAAGFGSIWLKRPEGFVDRIDAATASITSRIDTDQSDTETCGGLGVASDAIWSCSFHDLLKIDPTTERIQSFAAGKVPSQGHIVAAAGRMWVLTGEGDRLVGASQADGSLSQPIILPVACHDLGTTADIVYVVCERGDRVLRVDPSTSTVTAEATIKEPSWVNAAASGVWVTTRQALMRLDPVTLATTQTVQGLGAGDLGSIWADATGVWVHTIDPFLRRVDATGEITRVISGPYKSGGDILSDGTYLWATDFDTRLVIRLEVPARP